MYRITTATVAVCLALACAVHAAEEQPSPPAHYDFAYAVNEPATGDQKDQRETRDGDQVNGYYRTLDPDGYVRTVKYKSDAVNGFTADVIREPASGGPAKAVVAAKAPPPAVVPAPYVAPSAPYVAPSAPYVAPSAPYVAPSAPYVAPAPYYYAPGPSVAAYPYYNYQPYPYAYSPYPYQPYDAQYPFVGQYPSPSEAAAVRQ